MTKFIIHKYLSIILLTVILSSCGRQHTMQWAQTIDQPTELDSWGTWDNFFAAKSRTYISESAFMEQSKQARCQEITPAQFLAFGIENHRLERYLNARSAEEAYPAHDRPRGDKDTMSVTYFLQTTEPISPITVAKFIDNQGKTRLVKLDGVHRLMAAAILRQPLRVCWLDLTAVAVSK